MARKPRREIIDASNVGVYHVISRCVRRAFLMGYDSRTQQQVSHRRDWIRSRMEFLASIFMIEPQTSRARSSKYSAEGLPERGIRSALTIATSV